MELLLVGISILAPLGIVYVVVRRARGHTSAVAATMIAFGIASVCWSAFELIRQPAVASAMRALMGLSFALIGRSIWQSSHTGDLARQRSNN